MIPSVKNHKFGMRGILQEKKKKKRQDCFVKKKSDCLKKLRWRG